MFSWNQSPGFCVNFNEILKVTTISGNYLLKLMTWGRPMSSDGGLLTSGTSVVPANIRGWPLIQVFTM